MPSLVILNPRNDASVPAGQPLSVAGQARDKGMPEPVLIDSVTVQVDGGPAIAATLKPLHEPNDTVVGFEASVEVTGAEGAHSISVVATNDNGISATPGSRGRCNSAGR
jgi:hypothetical protein